MENGLREMNPAALHLKTFVRPGREVLRARKSENLKCLLANKLYNPLYSLIYISRCICLWSTRTTLTCLGASFRRFSLRLKCLTTTLSHLLDDSRWWSLAAYSAIRVSAVRLKERSSSIQWKGNIKNKTGDMLRFS